eukprot:1367510-Amphidinium_carterae.1
MSLKEGFAFVRTIALQQAVNHKEDCNVKGRGHCTVHDCCKRSSHESGARFCESEAMGVKAHSDLIQERGVEGIKMHLTDFAALSSLHRLG